MYSKISFFVSIQSSCSPIPDTYELKRREIKNIQRGLGRHQKILYAIKPSDQEDNKPYWLAYGWLDGNQKNFNGDNTQRGTAQIQVQDFSCLTRIYLLLASDESQKHTVGPFPMSKVELEIMFKSQFSDTNTQVEQEESRKRLHDEVSHQSWELFDDFQERKAITHEVERKLMYGWHNFLIK